MKNFIICLTVMCVLSACSLTKEQVQPLLNTVNIGVLEDTRLADWRLLSKSNQTLAGNVIELPYDALLDEMRVGNVDLIVGIPETDDLKAMMHSRSIVLEERVFDYLVYKEDQRLLSEYVFESSFLRQVQRVGYVAKGESGVVNELVMPKPLRHQSYIQCDSLEHCFQLLVSQEIDAIYSDTAALDTFNSDNTLVTVGFEKSVGFTLLMNDKTLTQTERNELGKLFSNHDKEQTF
ncbi:hypothetical protein [Pseudoalteromonas sp. MMG024]|uniref:hypothetical protein n=1 Tax=Pseudoalteromonas sp. MMG024 TaxID=2909980 RepID=UPI001F178EA2|nr:hypothetical protein [Pseudoalteromonas sp. MMG024]MCF6455655.1 hypothetical protein [Pseudoalteromonas sp. MMG024]